MPQRLKAEKEKGHFLILINGLGIGFAKKVASYVNVFDRVVAIDNHNDLSDLQKRRFLENLFVEQGFEYVGESSEPRELWPSAEGFESGKIKRQTSSKLVDVAPGGIKQRATFCLYSGAAPSPVAQEFAFIGSPYSCPSAEPTSLGIPCHNSLLGIRSLRFKRLCS